MKTETYNVHTFTSYSGIKLPLKLIGEIPTQELRNRNTYYEGLFDLQNRLCLCRRIAYGEIELEHRYRYHDNGQLKQALITEDDDETTTLHFDEQGKPL